MKWRSPGRASKTGNNGGQQPRPSPPLPSYSPNVSDALRSGRAIGSEQGTIFTKVLYTRRGSAKSIPFGSTLTIASSWQCGNAENTAHFFTHCPDGLRTKFPGLVLSIAVLPASISTASSLVELRRAISSYIWRRFCFALVHHVW